MKKSILKGNHKIRLPSKDAFLLHTILGCNRFYLVNKIVV